MTQTARATSPDTHTGREVDTDHTATNIAMPAVADLVPHAAPMLLIDRVCDAGPNHLLAEVKIDKTVMFYEKDRGVPTYVGIEHIAQAVAAYAGWRGRQSAPDTAPAIGYLLGTRKMTLTRDWFETGSQLHVYVENIFEDGEMGVFKGEISVVSGDQNANENNEDTALIVSAQINVYQPGDAAGTETAATTETTTATFQETNDKETATP